MNPGRVRPWPSAGTKVFGLLGHPVSHSLSPSFQNAALRALELDACYLAFDVPPNFLPAALAGARALGVAGLNATVPHKEDILRLADEIDPRAALVGAANTLVPVARGWKAYNTDVDGLIQALSVDLEFLASGRRALVVGAGGAARAAVVGLLQAGIQEIFVANRNIERAEGLVRDLATRTGVPRIQVLPLGGDLPEKLERGDLVVDSTPAGLQEEHRWPWDLGKLGVGFVVYDMAYRFGGETPLVEMARTAGLRAASGRRMLLYQGAAALTLWTGLPAPLDVMEKALSI